MNDVDYHRILQNAVVRFGDKVVLRNSEPWMLVTTSQNYQALRHEFSFDGLKEKRLGTVPSTPENGTAKFEIGSADLLTQRRRGLWEF
jgi:hypothetical protein